ncbi:MAG: hypothetical protein KF869_02085 [Phycisphaeraceae bacterium]|nr:hypothetical protein [Phycisphaeraceae bacterium]
MMFPRHSLPMTMPVVPPPTVAKLTAVMLPTSEEPVVKRWMVPVPPAVMEA